MRIALCGSAPSSAQLAPFRDATYEEWSNRTQQFPTPEFADETWSIWGCSPGFWAVMERATVWMELHRWEPGKPWFSPEYVSFLQKFKGRVITGGPVPEIKNHVVCPIERIEKEFSAYFLHSSLSLMAAMAILEIEDDRKKMIAEADGAEPAAGMDAWMAARDDIIGFWGVDMAAHEEYESQRSGCHFFILEALRRGIQIYVPPESCLLRPMPVYGISEWDHNYIKATQRARELNQRKAAAEQQVNEAAKTASFLAGALDNHDYWIKTWTSPYGIPAGLRVKHDPGTGLGGGITLHKSFSPPPDEVIEAGADQAVATAATLFADSEVQTISTAKPKKKAAKRRK